MIVIAREAKQSSPDRADTDELDCVVANAPRNDGESFD
jgi:hypothetical protein